MHNQSAGIDGRDDLNLWKTWIDILHFTRGVGVDLTLLLCTLCGSMHVQTSRCTDIVSEKTYTNCLKQNFFSQEE
jgi:hypothetical protein